MLNLIISFTIHAIIAAIIAVGFGAFHEYLHRRKAKLLGCKVKSTNWRKNETVIDTGNDPVKIKQIARAPYVVIVPLAIGILLMGIYYMHIGLMVGGGGTLFLHVISYPLEGRDEEHQPKSD